MERLLVRREEALAAGARSLGWKVAFGAPAAREALGLSGPVVGFLTDATVLSDGGRCAVGGWSAPKLEPEIGIRIGAPLDGDADAGSARAAIAGISAAIELADADRPPAELEEVLAGDIYHRAFLVSDEAAPLAPGEPIAVEVERDGEPLTATADAEAATGDLVELVAHVARYLAGFGCALAPGEVVISGSTVPLIDVAPGQSYRVEVAGAGAVGVELSGPAPG
jgi:2-keto-4-pentenoate hydratase